MTDEALTAIVADDDPLARRLVRDILRRAGIAVVAEAQDGRQAVDYTLERRPGVLLMDVIMPKLDGIAATRRILQQMPGQVIVLLTRAGGEDLGIIGLRAGAAGYLHKDMDLDSLPRVLRAAVAGEAAISRSMTRQLIEHLRTVPEEGTGLRPMRNRLTARECDVLDLLCEGRGTGEIADELVLAQETVRSHIKNILRKLDVSSRREAVQLMRRLQGLDE